MPIGEAIAKASPIRYIWLETAEDLGPALLEVREFGYRGFITSEQNPRDKTWRLGIELNANEGGGQCHATLGDVLVWDGAHLSSMSRSDYLDKHEDA